MVRRVLAALFGAVVFAIIVPIAYYLAFEGFPLQGVKGLVVLAGAGVLVGAILGALFPRVFGFVFQMFLDG